MKHLKKTLFASALLLVLAGCTSTQQKDLTYKKTGEEYFEKQMTGFEPKAINENLAVGEKKQLEINVYPSIADASATTYTSTDASIVSVDASGMMEAKALGKAILTVKCGDFSRKVYVCVTKEATKAEAHTCIDTIIANQQKPEFKDVDYLTLTEFVEGSRYKNGSDSPEYVNNYYETMICSKSEAYFYDADSVAWGVKTEDGAVSYADGGWLFYVTESYEGFLCRISANTKHYMVVNCAEYQGTESGRWGALCEIMDNIFGSGCSVVLNQYENSVGTSDLELGAELIDIDYSNVPYKYYAKGSQDTEFYQEFVLTFDSVIRPEDSRYNDIPTGVTVDTTQQIAEYFEGNYCRYQNVMIEYDYEWRGDTYVDMTFMNRNYDITKKDLYYPDFKAEGFSLVDTVYDL